MKAEEVSSNSNMSQKSQKSQKSKKSKNRPPPTKLEIGGVEPPEEQLKVLDRPTPCTVLAVVTTLFILILLIIALGQFGFHDESAFHWERDADDGPKRIRLDTTCQTEECVHYSSELFDMMDGAVDPCEDFHRHVCDDFDPKERRLEHLVELISDRSAAPEHPKAMAVVRKMLSKCAMEKAQLDDDWRRTILPLHLPFPILSSLHPKKNTSATAAANLTSTLTTLLIHISHHTPDDVAIFGILPSRDSEFTLFIVKPKIAPPTEFDLRNVLEILMPRGNRKHSDDVERQIMDVKALQQKLSGIEFDAHPEVVRLADIQQSLPMIDWQRLIGSWYPETGRNTLTDKVYGFNTSYYDKVASVLREHPPETLYNLLLLRFSHTFLRHKLSSDREETCLRQVSRTVPGKIVLYGSPEPKSEELMQSMMGTIRSHLKESLSNLKWMDDRGTEEARRKFARTKFLYGFDGEESIDEMTLNATADYITILRDVLVWQSRNMFKAIAENEESVFLNSMVFYSVEKNRLTISRALLHYPFISPGLPSYTNFATIASRILPHLVHVFDERGRFYDANGNHRDWWSPATERYFRIIVRCFEGMMQNVLGVSVSIGWNAYNSTTEPYSMLPGRENLTDTALFFYSFVKTMCSWDGEKVNEALASVPQFIEAFQCNATARMNPETKCRLAS